LVYQCLSHSTNGGIGIGGGGEGDPDSTNPREDNARDVEIRRIMEDIRTSGGVDPQYFSTIKLQVSMFGVNPITIVSNPNDLLRALAEMILFLNTRSESERQKKILPPPAPNSPNAIQIIRERLIEHHYLLHGRSQLGTPSALIMKS